MNSKRVVITGLGALSPLGNDVKTSWNNAVNGVSGIGPITRVNADEYPAKVAAELKDFKIEDYMDKKTRENGPLHTICRCVGENGRGRRGARH